ncbi:tetratricopeptide repeat-containing sensor histidine kinase [Flavobacterium chilense]|uniref:histidine kinase n=1 Tax=Flavobacterium chilense TaxID=946677 RepID=A0A1M6XD14_9FLAO|nr:tetratricopeptide repeat-containing sensor histidine kinase [Flavobacterium chilense]SHL03813.1 Histidine kinase-, DNA gyrase B-, and HSP90-like ATPase [Flavobacterium chilense]
MKTLPRIIICLFLLFSFFSCKKNEAILYDQIHIDNLSENKKKYYLDSIVELLKSKKNDSVVRNLYLNIASEYYYLNDSKKSLAASFKALQLSKQVNDSVRMAKAFYYVGDCYENSKKDSSYFYYLKAEKLYYAIDDYDNVARMLFNKAHVLFYDGNYVECEIEVSKALQYLKKSGNHQLLYSCYTLMGNCLEKSINYIEALRYHNLALSEIKRMKINDTINNYNVISIINICNLYDLQGQYSKSIKELEGLVTDDLKKKWPRLYANVLSNLAYSKMKSGDYKNVESMFAESLKIVDSIGIESDVLYKKIYIGEYFLTQKDTIKSIQNLKEVNQLAIKIKSSNEILTSLKLLSEIDKKNSLAYTNEYIKLSDSINSVQKNANDKYARIEYETSRIEDENKILTKKNFYILIISFALVLLLLIILILRYSKYKNKELQFLKKQKLANEEIYLLLLEQQEKINNAKEKEKSKIAKELHDGIMNRIYGVRMNLGFFNSKCEKEIIEKRKTYIFELQNIENEIRTISHDLSYNNFLDGNDFNTLLLSLVENQKEISNTQFKYFNNEDIDWKSIQNIYKINLYRIIQEAILNINKYANAKNCEIRFEKEGNRSLKMIIVDDGQGFDVKIQKNGIGLNNMKERADLLKGDFKVESKIGEGTKIEIIFKL